MESNPKSTKIRRRTLRTNATASEQSVWAKLRCQQLGTKFRRQFGIGPYIVDFYAPSHRLVIEIDGDSHFSESSYIYDQARTDYLEQFGIRVLRYTNAEVRIQLDDVVEDICRYLNTPP
ncbi:MULTISPECIES: endonuclease domain-containing protein [unclassified Vibrio]|uniref:endonuclease domain-containing protein n=1 Tax=unclassified Vibrio TaxID=2614977 RepID=UPI000B8EB24D|nr:MULTISPECIES: endonuclease domain-containing protein [unclassified Vibrio]NAX43181.1 DUF559 domain-containing protein [Vibrio sp. V25_P4S6T154]OXX44189.1 DNA methyltransferase [Vibrio sp. V17_P4S1T151]OXX61455.1 DNA methyltransferase [Vibrio sp. V15_P4S5T153]OXX69876.1 DNA methyltransferase [Vibrio sp. V20_P4S3T152]